MGYEINGALGAKMAAAKKTRSIRHRWRRQLLHVTLRTTNILTIRQKINIMLFDNSGFGCINNLQMANGSDSFFCEFRDSDNQIMQVDYAKIAEGYGAKVYRANTKEDLISALEDAKHKAKLL